MGECRDGEGRGEELLESRSSDLELSREGIRVSC
jgi:hypothetical protein